MNALGVTTWLAHGSLLGWYWGQRRLPWDDDLDSHLMLDNLEFLASYYNMTVYEYGSSSYLLDINPAYNRSTEPAPPGNAEGFAPPGKNNIDARYIDMQSGLFVDMTALAPAAPLRTSRGVPGREQRVLAKDGHQYRYSDVFPLQASAFEGCAVLVPREVVKLLSDEYGADSLTRTTYRGFRGMAANSYHAENSTPSVKMCVASPSWVAIGDHPSAWKEV
ncbi:mannosyltransferase [Friedmanniomyces endolithicus]|uniref:Mannosyltransferase n=1 Tax=Friedmanniomyces endolithicus TaxID=329885 RepID=A0AAN6KGF8_9PEZI|nr:mannosyltransferase [Friedmanniomyces endolithicus]KAK0897896.1 mannosyltransferase [Friedmanniomyces endolithicus]KAK0981541.1 mannosyltransferase [Friedmanniomyces endolithicus]KAK0981725.1 mannosyltransferase [Friedmanniomyces endolithicus]